MLLDQYSPQMAQFFENRTRLHIRRVHLALVTLVGFKGLAHAELHRRGFAHDASKFEPAEKAAYIWLTEHHRQWGNGNRDWNYPEGIQAQVDQAIVHHYSLNDHHPEYHQNLGEMPDLAVIEMVCDWTAMAQELNRTNSARQWAEQHVGPTWDFPPAQKTLIFEAISALEERLGPKLPKI